MADNVHRVSQGGRWQLFFDGTMDRQPRELIENYFAATRRYKGVYSPKDTWTYCEYGDEEPIGGIDVPMPSVEIPMDLVEAPIDNEIPMDLVEAPIDNADAIGGDIGEIPLEQPAL